MVELGFNRQVKPAREKGGLDRLSPSYNRVRERVTACPSCTSLLASPIMGLQLNFRSVCPIAKNIFELF